MAFHEPEDRECYDCHVAIAVCILLAVACLFLEAARLVYDIVTGAAWQNIPSM